jgi:hypothetical protein
VSDKLEIAGLMDDTPRRRRSVMINTDRHGKSRYDYEDHGVGVQHAKGASKEDKREDYRDGIDDA